MGIGSRGSPVNFGAMQNDTVTQDPASDASPPTEGSKTKTKGKLAARTESAKQRVGPYVVRADESFIGQTYNRLLEIEFIDRSIALAAKAFIAFFPLLLAFVAVIPNSLRQTIINTIANRFGVTAGNSAVSGAFATAGETKAATGILGLVFLFFYATSFTTALQRLYLRAWRRPPGGGIKNHGRGILWIAGVVILVSVSGYIGKLLAFGPTGFLKFAFGVLVQILLWWWTAHTMLRGDVRWRPLLPGAVFTGAGMMIYGWAGAFWMPATVQSNEAQFGYFGVSLALVSWFVGVCFVLVISAAINAVLAEDEGWLGDWLRGPSGSPLSPHALAPLPPTTRRLRFADALGINPRDDVDS